MTPAGLAPEALSSRRAQRLDGGFKAHLALELGDFLDLLADFLLKFGVDPVFDFDDGSGLVVKISVVEIGTHGNFGIVSKVEEVVAGFGFGRPAGSASVAAWASGGWAIFDHFAFDDWVRGDSPGRRRRLALTTAASALTSAAWTVVTPTWASLDQSRIGGTPFVDRAKIATELAPLGPVFR